MKRPWEKQEARLANLSGGQVQPGSGNGWVRKQDVRSKPLAVLFEAKWTAHKSFTLKLADLRQLEHNAATESRTPVFAIEFREGTRSHRYVVVREEDYFGDDPHIPHTR